MLLSLCIAVTARNNEMCLKTTILMSTTNISNWIQQHPTDRLIETMINDMTEVMLRIIVDLAGWESSCSQSITNHFLSLSYKRKRFRLPSYFYNYLHNFLASDVHIPRVSPLPYLMPNLPFWLKICTLEVCALHKYDVMVKESSMRPPSVCSSWFLWFSGFLFWLL